MENRSGARREYSAKYLRLKTLIECCDNEPQYVDCNFSGVGHGHSSAHSPRSGTRPRFSKKGLSDYVGVSVLYFLAHIRK